MLPNKILIRRAGLYERVWATPLRTLAKEFGLSDVGLAKAGGCDSETVPIVAGEQLDQGLHLSAARGNCHGRFA